MKPGTPEWHKRVEKLMAEEHQQPEKYWWFSFADAKGWRGGAITRCHGILHGLKKLTEMGLNPGGQVLAYPSPNQNWVMPHEVDRLYKTEAEAEAVLGKMQKLR